MKARGVFYFGKFLFMGIAFLALFTYVVMLLWNWLVPELFNGPVVSYWQTLGILVLSKILFAGLGNGRKDRMTWKKDHSWRHDPFRSHWKKRFEEKMNERCGEDKSPDKPQDNP
jgi:hypothetical protein